jgi:CRP-like cAMP-binding protein
MTDFATPSRVDLDAPFDGARHEEGKGFASTRIETGNRLLDGLAPRSWESLHRGLELTTLATGAMLEQTGQRPTHLYFPVAALVSLEAARRNIRLQMALVGREGMIGSSLLLDAAATSHAMVQFGGTAWRISADRLADALATNRGLHAQLLRGVGPLIERISMTALLNAHGLIEQRLADWLLMAAEKLDTDTLHVTHDALACALGVRRAGVTVALHVLEGKGGIRSQRGAITVHDRERLAASALFPPAPKDDPADNL